jgi:hypothetical protein
MFVIFKEFNFLYNDIGPYQNSIESIKINIFGTKHKNTS